MIGYTFLLVPTIIFLAILFTDAKVSRFFPFLIPKYLCEKMDDPENQVDLFIIVGSLFTWISYLIFAIFIVNVIPVLHSAKVWSYIFVPVYLIMVYQLLASSSCVFQFASARDSRLLFWTAAIGVWSIHFCLVIGIFLIGLKLDDKLPSTALWSVLFIPFYVASIVLPVIFVGLLVILEFRGYLGFFFAIGCTILIPIITSPFYVSLLLIGLRLDLQLWKLYFVLCLLPYYAITSIVCCALVCCRLLLLISDLLFVIED